VTAPVPIDLDGADGSLEPFGVLDALADRARVAYLVEMDHFIHEKFAFRLLCMRYLAARGWRVFGEELDHRQGERIDSYLRTGDESLLDQIDEPDWYTRGALASAPTKAPMPALYAEQRRLLRTLRAEVPDARWFGFDIGADDTDYLELANAAESIDDLGPAMALRERRMHARVAAAFAAHPGEKIALMAGSLHLMKDDSLVDAPGGAGPGGDSADSIGHHVARHLSDGPVLSIWLLHGEGRSANPWLPPPGELTPARRTLDADLLARVDRPVLLRVDDDTERRHITQMHNLRMSCRLSDQVDAIVFAPHVTPLRP
jgi:erythromycin esterase-like protein